MPEELAIWVVRILGVYGGLGLLFLPAFLARGARSIDPVAGGGTWGFRAMIAPGVVALWPLLLKRWLGGDGVPPTECNAHRRRAAEGGS